MLLIRKSTFSQKIARALQHVEFSFFFIFQNHYFYYNHEMTFFNLCTLAFIWFLKSVIFYWNHEITFFIFCTFSVWGCLGQPMLDFQKLVLIINISTSQNFNYKLTYIFLSLRAKLKETKNNLPSDIRGNMVCIYISFR